MDKSLVLLLMPLMFLMLLNFGLPWKLLKQALGSFQTLFFLVYNEKSTMNSVNQGPPITQQKQLLKLLMILTVELLQLYLMEELLGVSHTWKNTGMGHCSWNGEGVIIQSSTDWKIVHLKS